MPAGRKQGQLTNPRDDRGWMIPKPGTIRRKVYDLLVAGRNQFEICGELGMSRVNFAVNKHYIEHSEQVNARETRNRQRWGK